MKIVPGSRGLSPPDRPQARCRRRGRACSTTCTRSPSRATAQLAFERYFTGHDEKILKDLGTVALHARDAPRPAVGDQERRQHSSTASRSTAGSCPPPEAPLLSRCSRSIPTSSPTRTPHEAHHRARADDDARHGVGRVASPTPRPRIPRSRWSSRTTATASSSTGRSSDEPGENWIYSGGAVALIGAIIERGHRQAAPRVRHRGAVRAARHSRPRMVRRRGRRVLGRRGSAPLDAQPPQDRHDAGRPRHVTRGQRIVSEAWIDASWQKALPDLSAASEHYGYLWYMFDRHAPLGARSARSSAATATAASGCSSSPISASRCVIFCGRYDGPEQWVTPIRVWREIIVLKNLER